MANEIIYTIGYEGARPDDFIRKLHAVGIEQLIDVRAVPFSRKPGFSADELCALLADAGIEYRHFPQLGIPSEFRKSADDSESLFALYENVLLPRASKEMAAVARLCARRKSVLLCFEANPKDCHRSRLSRCIAETFGLIEEHLWMDLGMFPGF